MISFGARGFATVRAEQPELLEGLRTAIFNRARSLVPYRGESAEAFFNGFHTYGLGGAELNAFRLALVDFLTRELTVSRTLLAAFHDSLTALTGPDVAAQKTVNLVVQQPGDADQVPIHRDAPSNSHFEVVLWLPLVDAYGSKGMFSLDRADTERGLALLQGGAAFAEFERYTRERGTDLEVRFGEAFVFAAGIAHGCRINVEPETRWALNLRYKTLFSPYGNKGLPEFFEVLSLSPLSEIAFAFERQEFGLDPQ